MKILTPFVFFSILFIGLPSACRQPAPHPLEWPEITRQTKPWSRWWWHGSSVTKAGITAEMEAYQKAGLGGLEITPIYGIRGEEEEFIDYLSPQWMEMLTHSLQEAERLDMGVDMATGTGWPFGGPWVAGENACKYLAHEIYHLEGGERLSTPVVFQQEAFVRMVSNPGVWVEKLIDPVEDNENLQALAIDQVRFEKMLPLQALIAYSNAGEIVDLTGKVVKDGQLNWTASEGRWTLYALFEGRHGKMVERAAPGGEGNVIDHFSTEAIQHYLARFDSAFAGEDIRFLRAFFNDSYEVDDARGQANWTPALLDAFRRRRGYELLNHLPALFGEDSEEKNRRVLSDYRETISGLLLETFTRKWGAWARENGAFTRNQAHGSPANILDLYAASDIPETEGTDIIRIKFATSAAHVTGRKLASSESATWLNEHFLSDLANIKENVDRYLVGGVNHIFYHGTSYSPPDEEWPGRLFYAAVHANPRNSLWRDMPALNQYIARTQAFLQSGRPDNDVLLYFPIYDRFATPGRELLEHFDGHGPGLEETAFKENADFLQSEGYAFDFISDRQIRQLTVENGRPRTGGTDYQTIVLPASRFIPLATMEKLVELARNGAAVIVHKNLPESVPGLGGLDVRQQKYQAILDRLQFRETASGIRKAEIGEGAFLLGEDLDGLLKHAGVLKETMVNRGLAYTRRRHEGGKLYFITNWSEEAVEGWIPLQTEAGAVALFDPMHGKKGYAKIRASETGAKEVYLQLPRGSSIILKTMETPSEEPSWKYIKRVGDPLTLNGPWSINFVEGGPGLPPAVESNALRSWTNLDGEDYQRFSGTARYRLSFPKPEGEAPGRLLDLGEVRESARVYLNGEYVATLIGPVYEVFLDRSLFRERNTLEIEVSNLMANRIADLDRRGVLWKKFYNINFPARREDNRGADGLFDASGWEPWPSGLLGPVTLSRVEF